MVVFHPLAAPAEKAPQPLGTTDAGGRFSLTMLKAGDGAPLGEYAVTIELREPRQILARKSPGTGRISCRRATPVPN
jgi:hypothetical protein